MYYKFSNNYIKRKTIKVPLSTFSGVKENNNEDKLPVHYVDKVAGFRLQDGVLKGGAGVSEYVGSDGIKLFESQFNIDNVYPFNFDGETKFLASTETRACELNPMTKEWDIIPGNFFSGGDSVAFTVGELPSIIIPKKRGGLYKYNGDGLIDMNLDSYSPVAMCTHMNRLFLANKGDEYRLRFSEVNNPYDFHISLDKGGEIYLDVEDGKIVGMLSYNNNLYIFREYAIYRLTAFMDQRDFSLKRVATTTTKIRQGSMELVDNGMIFMTHDAIYMFDGYSIRKILGDIDNTVSKMYGKIDTIYYNGKYYVTYCDGVGTDNNSLIEYDIMKNTISKYKGISIIKFFIIRYIDKTENLGVLLTHKKKMYIMDSTGCLEGELLPHYWEVEDINFGSYDIEKEVVSVTANAKDRYAIIVENDKGYRKKVFFDGSHKKQSIGIRGYSFKFTIISSDNGIIHTPIIELKV